MIWQPLLPSLERFAVVCCCDKQYMTSTYWSVKIAIWRIITHCFNLQVDVKETTDCELVWSVLNECCSVEIPWQISKKVGGFYWVNPPAKNTPQT